MSTICLPNYSCHIDKKSGNTISLRYLLCIFQLNSGESNMSPPRTPLHIVKPALGSPWLALTIHTGLSGSAEAILKQAAWEGEQRRDSQSLSALRAMALLAPESRGPHGAGGLLQ